MTMQNYLIMGTLQRWNGSYSVHKVLENKTAENVIEFLAGNDYTAHNSLSEENGRLFWSQSGHDNPCRPSVFEIRSISQDAIWDMDDMDIAPTTEQLESMSNRLTEQEIQEFEEYFDYYFFDFEEVA